MDVERYREFVELILNESYSHAAKLLYMSQPTLSRHIKALEDELRVKLVTDDVPVRTTPVGSIVFDTALKIVNLHDALIEELNDVRHLPVSRIRIHMTNTLKSLYPHLIYATEDTRNHVPNVKLEYVSLASGIYPEEALLNGECDLTFVYLTGPFGESSYKLPEGIGSRKIPAATGRLTFGIPRHMPYSCRDEIPLEDLRSETFQVFAFKSHEGFRRTFVAKCKEYGFRPMLELVHFNFYEEFYFPKEYGNNIFLVYTNDFTVKSGVMPRLAERLSLIPVAQHENIYIEARVLFREGEDEGALGYFIEALERSGEKEN